MAKTYEERLELIDSMIATLSKEMHEKARHMPENWDTAEIRQCLTDTVRETYKVRLNRYQQREYNNDRLINSNL